ncbi:MAG: 50S ribosomal protein L10 [Dehalococcoidia bacterium]|nr:50S ribosomal protein L10 [Dehalococcoidia bacterium]
MPTPEKEEQVRQIKELIETSTVAIGTNNNGLSVADMTELRRVLRENGVRLRVVKNTLAHIAADEAGAPAVKDIVTGPTGIAFGFDDPAVAAKTLTEHLASSRIPMTIVGGYLSGRSLTPEQVDNLAKLPSKEILVGQVLGQLQAPIAGLVGTLQAPMRNLAYVLSAPQVGLVTALKAIADQKESE